MRHIYLCEYNSQIFYGMNLFQSTVAMSGICQKSIPIYQDYRNKGFIFVIKEAWDRVGTPENYILNINSYKWTSTSSPKSFLVLTSNWWVFDCLIFHPIDVSVT